MLQGLFRRRLSGKRWSQYERRVFIEEIQAVSRWRGWDWWGKEISKALDGFSESLWEQEEKKRILLSHLYDAISALLREHQRAESTISWTFIARTVLTSCTRSGYHRRCFFWVALAAKLVTYDVRITARESEHFCTPRADWAVSRGGEATIMTGNLTSLKNMQALKASTRCDGKSVKVSDSTPLSKKRAFRPIIGAASPSLSDLFRATGMARPTLSARWSLALTVSLVFVAREQSMT